MTWSTPWNRRVTVHWSLALPGVGPSRTGLRAAPPRGLENLPGPLRAKPGPIHSFAGTAPRPRHSFALRPQATGRRSAGPRAKQPFAACSGLTALPESTPLRILRRLRFARGAREARPPQGCQGLAGPSFAVLLESRRGEITGRAGKTNAKIASCPNDRRWVYSLRITK